MPRLSKIGAAALAAFGWTSGAAGITANYLVVAGGGAGGYQFGGGGGGGGYLTGTASLNPSSTYTVTVGAGGAAPSSTGNNGSNSSLSGSGISTVTSTGGGGGGSYNGTTAGQSGGSGGGGSYYLGAAGSGTAGQGNNGGANATTNGVGGGGGGAGGAGTAATGNAGAGGIGTTSSITGTSTYYAGGGGGGGNTGSVAPGGNGGGGAGGVGGPGTNGTANTGGGGGGNNGNSSGAGGSGVVIISYPAPQQFGGGIVTTSGSNVIHTFTTSGTLSPLSTLSADYLIVAGGGSGQGSGFQYVYGGGGGAGGLLTGSGLTIDTNSIYVVTVGAGAAGTSGTGAPGVAGSNSVFSAYSTASVGGAGGATGVTGGSGAGGGSYLSGNSSGTSGQGNAGGAGTSYGATASGGGGGGAGSAGTAGSSGTGGAGGSGTASSISGTSTTYAGGGGGGGSSTGGAGGSGGGGAGAAAGNNGTSATANTGGGGGAAATNSGGNQTSGNGGSGIVIIRYAGSTQLMAGGTVTITGGYVIHTFTSSGYLTPLKLLNNSLRFRSSATAYLTRTPTTAGNTQTLTFSAWCKRSALNTNGVLFSTPTATTTNCVRFNTQNTMSFFCVISGTTYGLQQTTQLFRDPAAWYHVVAVLDTTNAVAADRMRLYVNGVRVTGGAIDNVSSIPQNSTTDFNSTATTQYISRLSSASTQYIDGYLAEINFVDGQALTPYSFGTYNSYGVWQPITYGGSYGTNGFYLPFTNTTSTTTLGYDFSPNGNNWTTNNISLTAGSTYDSMTDVPTLTSATAANYATCNPLVPVGATGTGTFTLSNGNLSYSFNGGTQAFSWNPATIGVTSGKWYFEVTPTSANVNLGIGWVSGDTGFRDDVTSPAVFSNYYSASTTPVQGITSTSGTVTGTALQVANGDIVGVAFDYSTGNTDFYKNGTLMGSITGMTIGGLTLYPYLRLASYGRGASTQSINFGQQPFVYTPPSGYVALNTYNL